MSRESKPRTPEPGAPEPQTPRTETPRPQTPRPWIRWIRDHEAEGALKRLYGQALERAGRIWNIVRIMSLRPRALQFSMGLYQCIMHEESERLGRAEREMIAVVVSRANQCHY